MTPPQVTRDVAWLRIPPYKRIDIGFQYQLVGAPTDGIRPYNFWRHFKNISIGLDVFNLLGISNVSSCSLGHRRQQPAIRRTELPDRPPLNVSLSVGF